MDLELPPFTHDVRTDWENIFNTVRARKQYWVNYLAYVMKTNRELLRMSDQIYQQPRIRLQGARPSHVFLSPQCYGSLGMSALPESQEHHCLKLPPNRRDLDETASQEPVETGDPLPDE